MFLLTSFLTIFNYLILFIAFSPFPVLFPFFPSLLFLVPSPIVSVHCFVPASLCTEPLLLLLLVLPYALLSLPSLPPFLPHQNITPPYTPPSIPPTFPLCTSPITYSVCFSPPLFSGAPLVYRFPQGQSAPHQHVPGYANRWK